MACNFSISFNDQSEILSRAQAGITKAGGNFRSEGSTGNFELNLPIGKIEGEYVLNGREMEITILHKPLLISCKMIEHKITEFLESPVS